MCAVLSGVYKYCVSLICMSKDYIPGPKNTSVVLSFVHIPVSIPDTTELLVDEQRMHGQTDRQTAFPPYCTNTVNYT